MMKTTVHESANPRNSLSLKDFAQVAIDLDAGVPFMVGGRADV
jgi:hypothetical protein